MCNGTNDQQEFNATGGLTSNTYGKIRSLVVMSTEDLVNWTYHGTIDMTAVCGQWLNASWAPSIVSREEADGKTHFYLYFSNSGGGVGVITSTSPLGPWTDPLGKKPHFRQYTRTRPLQYTFRPGCRHRQRRYGVVGLRRRKPERGRNRTHAGQCPYRTPR